MKQAKGVLFIAALDSEVGKKTWPSIHPLVYSGIGKLNAAIATYHAILEYHPKMIINLGTAASLHPNMNLTYEISSVVERDMDSEPLSPRGTVPFSANPSEYFSGFPGVKCGTGDSFVTKKDPWLNANKIDLVDMELFAIAKVSHHMNVRWRSIKFVSDQVGHNSDLDWSDNLKLSRIKLREWVTKNFA